MHWQTSALRSQSFFDNELKQMLSAVPDKNKQTVALPISGCFVVVAVQFVSILAQSTFPYRIRQPGFMFMPFVFFVLLI